MKISFSFLILLSQTALGCSFKNKARKIYSLSGPVTTTLKEVGLLASPTLAGISIFHPISKEEYKGKFLPGGIFLSRQMMDEMKGGVVYFDESRELSRMLKSIEGTDVYEIKTRGLIPYETIELVTRELGQITVGCENKFKQLKDKSDELSDQILKRLPQKLNAVFFLGEIRNNRPPEMAIVNDGIVKWLIDQKKLKTYPTPLAYVSWSAKTMAELPRDILLVGVKDPGSEIIKGVKKVGNKKFNLIYPGSLIPGITQLEAWLYFFNSI